MGKNNKAKTKPVAPVVEATETKEQQEIVVTNPKETPEGKLIDAVTGSNGNLDKNHVVELLGLATKYFKDTPNAAEVYNVPEGFVRTMDRCTMIGVGVMLMQEISNSNSDWAVSLRPGVIENLNEVAQQIGVTIDLKALPAPDKDGNVELAKENIKVPAKVKKQLKEEKEILDNKPYLDIDKIKSEEDLKQAIIYLFSERKDYLVNIQKAISLYKAYLEKEKKDSTKGITRIELLHKLIGLIEKAPIVITGIGNFLYSVTSATKSPVSAYCHLRNTAINKKNGKCGANPQFIADVVRELVIWKINVNKLETEDTIKAIKKNIEVLNSDKEKNAKAIKEQNERLETLSNNIKKFDSVLNYVVCPEEASIEGFKKGYKEGDKMAARVFKTLAESFYPKLDITTVDRQQLLHNLTINYGMVTNLFLSELDRFQNYTEAEFIDLKPIEKAEEKKEEVEKPQEESPKETPEDKGEEEKN